MQIEDVDLWEVIYEQGGSVGVYASYNPFAEFYMIRVGWFLEQLIVLHLLTVEEQVVMVALPLLVPEETPVRLQQPATCRAGF